MSLLLGFIVAMIVTMALVPLLMKHAGALRVLDAPNARKVHRTPIPRVGGIAMMVGTVLGLLPWLLQGSSTLIAVMLAAGIVFVFGVADDRADLSAPVKFTGQLLAIAVVIGFGGVMIDSYSIVVRHDLPAWFGVPLTVLFMLGVTNAINLSDGLDGLAGGTTLLSLVALGALAFSIDFVDVAVIAFVIAGAVLGFLRFNTFPARIFMGDGGSQFLGFMVAVLAVMFTQHDTVALSPAVPLLLLGLPVVDTLMVMAQRAREGRPLFSADRRHVHHKLLDLGFDHTEAVVVIYGIQALFFLAAWFMRYQPDPLIVGVFASLAIGVVGLLIGAGRAGWRWRTVPEQMPATLHGGPPLRPAQAWLLRPEHLPRWALQAAGVCVLAYLATVAAISDPATPDLAWLASALAIAAGVALVRPSGHLGWLAKGALYIAATLAVYLDHHSSAMAPAARILEWAVLPLLAVSVALRMRLSQERRFELSTLDVLLIFVALAVPNLPGLFPLTSNVGVSVLKVVALVYAIELVADQSARGLRLLAAGFVLFLLVVGARTII
jgi:UDP-GlcNAc:undecaprenyl-phosphate GlcNAc-1-phosphate transferase